MTQHIHRSLHRKQCSGVHWRVHLFGLGLVLSLTGCASGIWVRDNATKADLDRDSFHCQRESAKMFPPLPRQVPYGGASTVTKTTCKTRNNVETCDKHSTPALTYTTDDNDGSRQEAFEACMRAEGYRYEETR